MLDCYKPLYLENLFVLSNKSWAVKWRRTCSLLINFLTIENVPQNTLFVEGSINDKALIEKLFSQYNFSYVFHFAAYAAEGLSHFIRHFNYENNLLGSINLINASIKYKVKCFVFTSSIAVYGKNQTPMSEDLIPAPEDPWFEVRSWNVWSKLYNF